jgi:hypothetical protein
MPADLSSLERLLRPRGPTGLAEVATALSCTTKTVQRLIASAGDAVVVAGQTRRRRMAWARPVRGLLRDLPVYRIDAEGRPQQVARLRPIWPQGCLVEAAAPPWPTLDEARDGWYGGLPYPLYDMRPQGFLGRAFARHHASSLTLPSDPREWDDEAILLGLSAVGDDLPGDLLLGDAALRRFLDRRVQSVHAATGRDLPDLYAAGASVALEGGAAGSSAAGEFPKFLTTRSLPGAATPEVIVKFSGADDSPTAQRWRDLLVCEHLAGEALGSDAARTRLLAFAGRHFLESERFDRIGLHGRRSVISLEFANAGLVGEPSNDWTRVATTLSRIGLLPAGDLQRVAERQIFGRLIGNSDMHGGNLGFFVEPAGLSLAPSYDQLPMRYAPLPGGDVAAPPLTPELPLPAERGHWRRSAPRALAFWRAAGADARISQPFRNLCAGNADALERAMELA